MPEPGQDRSPARRLPEIVGRSAVYLPVLIAILIMLPRLIAPHFNLMDDARTIITSREISHGVWNLNNDIFEGRFRPVYWLWFTLPYLLFGENPFGYFLWNTLALVLTTAGVIVLLRTIGRSKLEAGVAGLLFALAGPVVEDYYTLSKNEVPLVFFLVLSLLTARFYGRAKTRGEKVGVIALTGFLLLLAEMSKETAIVVAPVSLVWYLAARFWPGRATQKVNLAVRAAYLTAAVAGAAIYEVLRTLILNLNPTSGSYTQRYILNFPQMITSLIRWGGWLIRDYAYLLPFVLLAIGYWIISKSKMPILLFDALVWMGAWVVIYLPWNLMAEYYILPFALGAAIFGSILTGQAAKLTSGPKRGWQGLALVCLGLTAVLFATTLLNNLSNGRIQMAVDAANAQAIQYLTNAQPNSVVWINIQDPNEYYYEIRDHLNVIRGRPDLTLLPFAFQPTTSPGSYYLLVPYVTHQPLLAVRMGVVEDTQNAWNESLLPYFDQHPGWQPAALFEQHFRLTGVDLPRLLCPFIKTRAFCSAPAPLLDQREFTFGWRIYKMEVP